MNDRLIVALDVPEVKEARRLVDELQGVVSFYKVGLELYTAAGTGFVRELLERGLRVFLDLKFYDIGETVKRAVQQVARLGVHFLTIHGSGPVMRAAVEGRADAPLKLLAVTVLTSFDEEDLRDLGYPCGIRELVELRARKACEANVDGLVCSPLEVRLLREIVGPGRLLVTPGVRPAGAERGDQKRVATPSEAIRNGADFVVVGRPITRAANPRQVALQIVEELDSTTRAA